MLSHLEHTRAPESHQHLGRVGNSVPAPLQRRNFDIYIHISCVMVEKGYEWNTLQCQVKIRELRQGYQKTREANSRSGTGPKSCLFYKELEAILSGDLTSTPKTPLGVSVCPGTADTGLDPSEEVVDEEVELDEEPELGTGSFGDIGSQDLFATPEDSSPAPLVCRMQERGALMCPSQQNLPHLGSDSS
ncbi:zinc finger and SCAN domain-containing protein 29-like [Emydura macquarii macquarii]|uniref:zinc finger and SCAN domain-containing protein 29-like n=1 Tax=Emydura macquarii macquarii TaxID=1129001 RepID=UPI00352AC091